MQLPELLNFGFFSIRTLYIFGGLGIFTSSFVVWFLGRRDGFVEFKLFDLFILTSILSSMLFIFSPFGVYSYIVGALFPIFILSRFWRWSVFRVLDIFSLSWSISIFVYFFGKFFVNKAPLDLIISFVYFVSVVTFTKLRDKSLKSGIIFSFFICVGVLLGVSIIRTVPYLIFYLILVTLSTVNLYFRFKRDMPNNKLSDGLLKFFKDTLTNKEKRLDKEQKQLTEEDPYLKGDRAVGNSEELDEAILEDLRKEDIDRQKASVNSMQVLVRKALARLKIGKYGVCEVCNNPIETARLKAYPEATTCIAHSK